MSEMALTADHLVVIGRGRLIADQPMAEFVAQSSAQHIRVRTPAPDRLMPALHAAGAQVASSQGDLLEVRGATAAEVGDLAASIGVALHELTPQSASLEEAFMELTHDSVEFHGDGADAATLLDAPAPAGPAGGSPVGDRTEAAR